MACCECHPVRRLLSWPLLVSSLLAGAVACESSDGPISDPPIFDPISDSPNRPGVDHAGEDEIAEPEEIVSEPVNAPALPVEQALDAGAAHDSTQEAAASSEVDAEVDAAVPPGMVEADAGMTAP
jgi:hypothetical protein